MNLTILIVGMLGLIALVVVGCAAFVEIRPVVREYRRRRQQRTSLPEDTLQIPVPSRFQRPYESGMSGAFVSMLSGLVLIALGAWEWSHFGFGGEWLTTPATVLDATLEPAESGSGNERAVLEYRYIVGEQAFVARWIDTEQTLLTGFVPRDELLALHERGEPMTVWYHPLLPNFPSLGKVSLWYVILIFALGAFLIVRALASLLAHLRTPTSARRAGKHAFPDQRGMRQPNAAVMRMRTRG